mmetsp:Transcript_37637/g.69523  ORF Transcript_37637/g.69523 Transcript_37637/m.69523 type:complete len:401 (+) Transcript_37637:130-1332(+)
MSSEEDEIVLEVTRLTGESVELVVRAQEAISNLKLEMAAALQIEMEGVELKVFCNGEEVQETIKVHELPSPCLSAVAVRVPTVQLMEEQFPAGSDKWEGAVLSGQCIYGAPGNASHVLQIDTTTQTASLVGDDLGAGGDKWCVGNSREDGIVYFFPYCHGQILRFDPSTQRSSLVGEDYGTGARKWFGCIRASDGCFYGIPANHGQLLRFDPATETTSLVGQDFGSLRYKWIGGALAHDGCIYAAPYNESRVMQFDPATQTSKLISTSIDLSVLAPAGERWSGFAVGQDGLLYAMPYRARQVLCFDPITHDATLVGQDLGASSCKYNGPVVSADGKIYAMPCGCKRVMQFDPATQTTSMVGPDLSSEGDCYLWEAGGVLADDGWIYCPPAHARHVMRIKI